MSEAFLQPIPSEPQAPVSVPADESANPAPATTDGAPAESKPQDNPDAASEARKAFRGVQKRIDELTRRYHEAEERGRQEADYWRQQAEAHEARLRELDRNKPAPKLEQFHDLEAFTEAQAKFQAERLIAERLEAEKQAFYQQQRQQQEAMQQAAVQQRFSVELETRLREAEKKYPDFRDVVTSPELPGIVGTPAFGAIWESSIGADVMYYIAKNPERAHQIMSLSPVGQVREIARIEAAIEAGKTVSSAPPPPNTVGGSKGTATKDPADMTYQEYVTWRRRSLAQKNR